MGSRHRLSWEGDGLVLPEQGGGVRNHMAGEGKNPVVMAPLQTSL